MNYFTQDSVISSYSRNLKLINALSESQSANAFDEFLQILELANHTEALQVMQPVPNSRKQSPGGSRGLLRRLADKFGASKSPKYPLGMDSGIASETSPSSQTNYQISDTILSPLKERHQATLITSGGGSKNEDFQLMRKRPINRCATIPTHSITENQGANSSRQTLSSFQTPSRSQELILISNLTIAEQEGADQSSGEPVVCWHPYELTQGNQDAQRSASPHYCHPSHVPASSESDSSSDSIMIDPSLILDPNVSMAIARDSAKVMSVKNATMCHNNIEEDYKMTSRPRGPCLIVNNIDFEGDIFPTRKGSDEDARRFDDIFQQLGFTVIMRRNQTADQMRRLFKDVAAECKPEHDSLFIFILSHGSEHGIYGTDGFEVYLESEIISCFDNRNCKAMLGKPKVFVIQACRGRSKDCGGDGDTIDSIAWSSVSTSPLTRSPLSENRVPASWLPSQPKDGKKRKHPIRTDMLLVFSCLAGFVSVRNELAGSWLGVALAYFLMTYAHERDLLRILNLVTSDVIQRESSNGHIQSIELKLLGWTKNLYFNPGIYL